VAVDGQERVSDFFHRVGVLVQDVLERQHVADTQSPAASEILYVFENYPVDPDGLTSARLLRLEDGRFLEKTHYVVNFAFSGTDQITLMMSYATDLFDAQTFERLVGHLERVLKQVTTHSGQRIKELDLLSDAERRQLLVEWNETAAAYPRDRCMHELFEEQAARNPEGRAVVYESSELSYGELNARANRLAHHLKGLGVGPDVIVALCVERSIEMVVGLLGILKAGGAYLPLDPQ